MKSYGIKTVNKVISLEDRITEEVNILGFSIIENVINEKICQLLVKKIKSFNRNQENKYSRKFLKKMQEEDQVRLPLALDKSFFDILFKNKKLMKILDRLFKSGGSFYTLNQQNCVINKKFIHNLSSWHRDFPYLPVLNSYPVCYSVLIALTEFNEINGATTFIPGSHLRLNFPSEYFLKKHSQKFIAKAGSVLIMDSQLLHKAGKNNSNKSRIGLNHVFANPQLRQQINIPNAVKNLNWVKKCSVKHKKMLGFYSTTPLNDDHFKKDKQFRKKT